MNLKGHIAKQARQVRRVGSRESGEWAAAAKSRGVEVFPLSGAPLTRPGDNVIEAAARAAHDYCKAPSRGLSELREAIADKLQREQRFAADPGTEILVTAGAMQGLNVIMHALLEPGDEVLVCAPGFFYYGIAELIGCRCVYAATFEKDGFAHDLERIERAITPRTKLLVLTNPNNPTGHLATIEELEGIAGLADKHDLLIISDDSYERMVYDGRQHVSFAALDGVKERAITVQSFTKSYAMTGWRVGYVIAPKPLTDVFLKVHEWMMLSCGYVEQKAAAAAMTGPQEWVDAIRTHFEAGRNALCDALEGADGLSFVRPEGGPYVFLNVSRCGMPSLELSKYVLDVFGVRSEPGEVFEGPGYIRLAFGTKDVDDAARAGKQVCRAAQGLLE